MSWNYPPGVTGNEYQIAGPDWEGELRRECRECDAITTWDSASFRGERWGTCQECGYEDFWYRSDEW